MYMYIHICIYIYIYIYIYSLPRRPSRLHPRGAPPYWATYQCVVFARNVTNVFTLLDLRVLLAQGPR